MERTLYPCTIYLCRVTEPVSYDDLRIGLKLWLTGLHKIDFFFFLGQTDLVLTVLYFP